MQLKSQYASKALRISLGTKNLGRVKNQKKSWEWFLKNLSVPTITKERFEDYLKLTVEQQARLKNVNGYWIGAHCDDGIRSKKTIHERDSITFDIDDAPAEIIELVEMGLTGLSHFEFLAHSTRKHCVEKPRIRMIFPLKEALTADKYTAAARILAAMWDIDFVDPVSFRIAQMMYLPSHSVDSDWFFHHNQGMLVDAEKLLADFGDWQDYAKLPYSEKQGKVRQSASKAEDPTAKRGLIGAFCRAYDIETAIAEFIPEIYTPGDGHSDKPRYTYTGGSAANGAVVEDDGLFLYSHHGTDPCGDRLVNAFDMVRVHLYGHLDKGKEESGEDFNPTSLPSYKAMIQSIANDAKVLAEYNPGLADAFEEDDVGEVEIVDQDEESDDVDQDIEDLLGAPAPGFDPDIEDLLGAPGKPAKKAKAKEKKALTPLERGNKKHAVIRIGGKTLAATFKADGTVDLGSLDHLHQFYENQPMPSLTGGTEPFSKWWNRQPERRTYPNGIGFWPNREVKGALNLWTGLAVKPDPNASCALFLDHVLNVICSGDEKQFRYVMGWCAHMIQRPEEKPGVALVLKGVKGAGKDTLGNYVGKLCPKHHATVSQMSHLTGKFNAHQEKALLLHVQEGFWAGDPSAVGPLNHLITSETAMIERKGVDPIEIDSYLRVFISSNEKWVVPATEGERRYAVFHVSPHRAKDRAYFAAILHERDNGGLGALLHYLQTFDLSDFDVGVPPESEGLAEQKIAGLKNAQAFWYEALAAGEIVNEEDFGDDRNWRNHPVRVHRDGLYETYREWWRDHSRQGHRELLSKVEFGKEISALCPSKIMRQMGTGADRYWVHKFPDLETCRNEFAAKIDPKITWGGEIEAEFNRDDDGPDLIG
jgi:hypothetical protein